MTDFFDVTGPQMETFARTHDLKLVRWLKDAPIWCLSFRHPRGGSAQIHVRPGPSDCAVLDSSWHRDDYDTETRRLAQTAKREVASSDPEFREGLSEELRGVLSWSDEDLGEPHRMTAGSWHSRWDKTAFERLDSHLPKPRT